MKRYLVGKKISLHGLTSDQIKEDSPYFHWLDDLSLDRHAGRSCFPNNMERMLSYFNQASSNKDLILLGIFENNSGEHIGNVTFKEINWMNRRAFIGYMLGNNDYAGKGIVTEAALMMMYYGFNKLNFERIHGSVAEHNTASLRVCEKTGLIIEGRMRKHNIRNGAGVDELIVGALRDEWLADYGLKAKGLFEVEPT